MRKSCGRPDGTRSVLGERKHQSSRVVREQDARTTYHGQLTRFDIKLKVVR